MSDEYVQVESESQLKDVITKTSIVILLALVDGRDAVNASGQEEFDDCIESKARDYRSFARINGTVHKAALKEVGVDMGGEPFPKFAIFANGKPRIVEDTVNSSLSELISEHGQED